jgi:3-methyladenine DNA glycosylase AlkC
MEQFALDLDALVATRLPEVSLDGHLGNRSLKEGLLVAGERLLDSVPLHLVHERVQGECDTIRSIAALGIGIAPATDPAEKLQLLHKFADDGHFAVREWAWIGLRHCLGEDLIHLVPHLGKWAEDPSELVRRFSCEITRPRGVWCRHLKQFKRDPSVGLPVLERLRADQSRYVQLSVGNWLNDAYRTQPEWVMELCDRWLSTGLARDSTIVRRGLRSRER